MKAILTFVLFIICTSLFAESKPNIVFILADDWGWTDWQMNGAEYGSTFYETPNLDQLANEGVYFQQAYAHPLCSPTRAALLTGKYPGARIHMHQAITGQSVREPILPDNVPQNQKTIFPQSRNHLPLHEITLAEELKKSGYVTCQFGKWHLGDSAFFPTKQGFDSQFAVGGAGPGRGGYFAPYNGLSDIEQGPEGEYIADRLTDEVCLKLEELKDTLFFIYLAHYNVHSPYQAKDELVEKYKAKMNTNNKHKHPVMAAMIESLDSSVGKIKDKLDSLGLTKNTIFIVMGDNGGVHWANDKSTKTNITSNLPLRAGKGCFYEGGVRVPLLIQYPQITEPGGIVDVPVHVVDFYPTLLSLTKTSVSAEKDFVDGVDITKLIDGNLADFQRPIFCHFPRKKQIGADVGGSYVRSGDYKLYCLYGLNDDATDGFELYNLKTDLSEAFDSAAFLPDLKDSLANILENWLFETGALIPLKNPIWHN